MFTGTATKTSREPDEAGFFVFTEFVKLLISFKKNFRFLVFLVSVHKYCMKINKDDKLSDY